MPVLLAQAIEDSTDIFGIWGGGLNPRQYATGGGGGGGDEEEEKVGDGNNDGDTHMWEIGNVYKIIADKDDSQE